MNREPPSAPEPLRFNQWIAKVELDDRLTDGTGALFRARMMRAGDHVNTLNKLRSFVRERWPPYYDRPGNEVGAVLKQLWAQWLQHVETRPPEF